MCEASPRLVVALTLASTCALGCRPETLPAGGQASRSRPVSVEVVTPTQTVMRRTTTQPATVHAHYEARVFAKTAGYLIELHADIGSVVKTGDVLAVVGVPEMAKRREAKLATIRRLEADERRAAAQLAVTEASMASYQAKHDQAKAEVDMAEAELTAAGVELNRVTDLVERQAVEERLKDEAQKKRDAAAAQKNAAEAAVRSADAQWTLAKAQRDAAHANLDVAKATTDVARRELDELDERIKYARLTAPLDGVVTQRNIDPGDLVRSMQTAAGESGAPLFVVTKWDKVRVRVAVPERDAPLATVGDAAQVTLQALPGQVFEGEITRVAGVLDEQTRTMLVELDLPNADGHLRPGMFGQATITLAPPGDTLTLPAAAVRYDERGSSYVYVVGPSNEVAVAGVQTGLDNGEEIEILAGLEGDQRVVGPLLRRLQPGQPVSVH